MSALIAMPVISRSGGALIASPNRALRDQIAQRLNGRCRPVQQALGGADALAKLEKGGWETLFLDPCLPDLDARELVAIIERRFPEIQVVLLDFDPESDEGNANGRTQGPIATDGKSWPRSNAIPDSPASLAPSSLAPLPGMLGSSAAMQQVYRMVRLVAPRMTTVLI